MFLTIFFKLKKRLKTTNEEDWMFWLLGSCWWWDSRFPREEMGNPREIRRKTFLKNEWIIVFKIVFFFSFFSPFFIFLHVCLIILIQAYWFQPRGPPSGWWTEGEKPSRRTKIRSNQSRTFFRVISWNSPSDDPSGRENARTSLPFRNPMKTEDGGGGWGSWTTVEKCRTNENHEWNKIRAKKLKEISLI